MQYCENNMLQPATGPLAQRLEHLTHNQAVVGSIPTGPTLFHSPTICIMTVQEIKNLIARSQERTPKTRKPTKAAQSALVSLINHKEKIRGLWTTLSSTEEQHLHQIWGDHA